MEELARGGVKYMGTHDGHRKRLRARFLRDGLSGFDEHNALELLLFYTNARKDTNKIAHDLIARFGSFSAVLDAPLEELLKVNGMGETSTVLLKIIPQMSAYYLESRTEPGSILSSTELAGQFLLPKFYAKKTEMAYVVALDDKRKVIRCTCISDHGITNAVAISVKKVVAEAVGSNATGIILAHNHPGGLALPSQADRIVTAQVYKALRFINVELVDHIVVADSDYVSMADSGYISALRHEN